MSKPSPCQNMPVDASPAWEGIVFLGEEAGRQRQAGGMIQSTQRRQKGKGEEV